MTTNCPNCGAPIDISRSSCEYCGTPYKKEVYLVEAPSLRIDYQPEFNDYGYEAFLESLSKQSNGLLRNYIQIHQNTQASQQQLLSNVVHATAWQPTPEEERKMIEDMRNVAPTIFPKVEPTVEHIKYNTNLERLMDTVWFWFAALIATILCSLLPFIIF